MKPDSDPWKLDEACRHVSVPNLDVVGWYDHCNGDILLHRTMVKEGKTKIARNGQRILIGPWSHAGRGKSAYGTIRFGSKATQDITDLEIRWFDYWLKGKQNGVDQSAPVKIFVMGDNKWRDELKWPLDRARAKVLYLTSRGNAMTPHGDGKLIDCKPEKADTDNYTYDPRNPIPSLHGPALFTIPTDQRPLADRKDILVYQTEPLTERIEVTGNPVVDLYASSSAADTDFFVRLIDVAPSGVARDVSLGMVRTRYRNGLHKPRLIEPGKVIKYTIRMNPTSNAFLPRHRIRLDITSSDFPNYDRNHSTATDQNADATLKTAKQTVYHGPRQSTQVILPWIPRE